MRSIKVPYIFHYTIDLSFYNFVFSLSGTAILFGWDGVKFEGLLYYDGDSPVMALGIIIEKIRMDEIVEKLFKKKLSGITWLTELNVGKMLLL